MREDGTVTSTEPLRLFAVRDTPLSVDEVIRAVADPRAGGVAVFIGMVRNHTGDGGGPAGEAGGEVGGEVGPDGFPQRPERDEGGIGHPGDARLDHGPDHGPDHGSAHVSGRTPLVSALEYVAHPSAAELLRDTAAKVLVDHPVTALAAVHRSGALAVGDLAVICAAAAPHRAEAFAACRALIDTLKTRVPIWKREEFEDGSHIWVGS
jgi:molybdopterin synthase catalytic subunit